MSETRHTSGPWRISSDGIWARSPWNAEVRIATVTICSPMNGIDWQANARLIAAAPDLLEVLGGLADAIGFAEWASPEHAEDLLQAIIKKWHGPACAAITRATQQD